MRINFILLLFSLFLLSYSGLAQKPISLTVLTSKLDSLQQEADLIYGLLTAKLNSDSIIVLNSKYATLRSIEYYKDDSLKVVYINEDSLSVVEFTYADEDYETFRKNETQRALSKEEKKLLHIKYNFKTKVDPSIYEITQPPNTFNQLLIIPLEEKYKVYWLTLTNQENIIPLGNDLLFQIDEHFRVNSWKKFHRKYIPTLTEENGRHTDWVFPSYNKDEAYIFPTDIAIFRYYGKRSKVYYLSALPPRSKRFFTYSVKKNEIRIQGRTPSEF